jgi:hypothetical protein
MANIEFQNVTEDLLSAVPEFRERYNHEFADWQPLEVPGQYIVFGFVVIPALRELLAADRQPVLLRRIFNFFEQMAGSSDAEVPNLLGVEIFEWLLGDPASLSVAWQYMGEETRKLARRMALILRRESILPGE